MIRLAALFLVWFASNAQAAQITENFTSRTFFDSGAAIPSEAVWNQTLGKIHPTLIVTGYNTAGSIIPVNIGDGRHGAFDSPATYANFGTTSGTTVWIDTARYPELNVTRFQLDSPWVLEAFGPNPLIIRSQSDVVIHGTINCAGGNGGNAAGSVNGAGGIGRCGGKDGGAGGVSGGNGQNGIDVTTLVTGGTGGASIDPSGGGGGGSWHSNVASDGDNATNGGTHGGSNSDPEFSTIAGGAGGGGGASVGTDGGGGGGAGGGAVLIYAVGDFELGIAPDFPSFIYANGGAGGTGNGTGTAGGGGGGGSVQVFAGGTVHIYNQEPTFGGSQANGGTGGGVGAGSGGDGAPGRSWFTGTGYASSGPVDYSPQEEFTAGDYAFFNASKQSVVTKPFDLYSTIPVLSSLTLNPVSLDFSVEFAGSDDAFASDDTGWQPTLVAIQGKRFVKFKFSIQTSSTTAPSMIDSAVLNYAAGIREDFEFKSAGCGRIVNGSSTPPAGFLLLSFFVFLFAAVLKLKARNSKRTRLK